MDHRAHVGLVDAHPERVGGDDHVRVALHEPVLRGRALVGRHPGVVADGVQAVGAQPLGHLVHVPARAAVDDRRPVRLVCERRRAAPCTCAPSIPLPSSGTTSNDRLGRSKPERTTNGSRSPRRVADLLRDLLGGGRGAGHHGRATRAGRSRRAGAGSRGGSRGPTPTRSGPRRPRTGPPSAPRAPTGTTRRRSAPASRRRSAPRRCGWSRSASATALLVHSRRDHRRRMPAEQQPAVLVGHQRDQRGDDHGQLGGGDPGELVAEALAAAGRHHDEAVPAVERRLHRLALARGGTRSKPKCASSASGSRGPSYVALRAGPSTGIRSRPLSASCASRSSDRDRSA